MWTHNFIKFTHVMKYSDIRKCKFIEGKFGYCKSTKEISTGRFVIKALNVKL